MLTSNSAGLDWQRQPLFALRQRLGHDRSKSFQEQLRKRTQRSIFYRDNRNWSPRIRQFDGQSPQIWILIRHNGETREHCQKASSRQQPAAHRTRCCRGECVGWIKTSRPKRVGDEDPCGRIKRAQSPRFIHELSEFDVAAARHIALNGGPLLTRPTQNARRNDNEPSNLVSPGVHCFCRALDGVHDLVDGEHRQHRHVVDHRRGNWSPLVFRDALVHAVVVQVDRAPSET